MSFIEFLFVTEALTHVVSKVKNCRVPSSVNMHLEYILQSFLYETKVSKLYFTYSPVLYLYDNIFQGIFLYKKVNRKLFCRS